MPKGLRAPSVSRPPRPAAATRVLMAASELFPLLKTGGLADVAAALSQALVALGLDVRLVLPACPGVADGLHDLRCDADLGSGLGHGPMRLLSGRVPGRGMPVWLLDCEELFGRGGAPYLDSMNVEWSDHALRFGWFSRIISALALGRMPLADGWRPDVVHCHDWHTGLVPLLSLSGEPRPRRAMTLHNAAFRGNLPLETASALGLPSVTDRALRPWRSTGFAFDEPTGRAMLEAVDRGVEAYERRPEHRQALQRSAISANFSGRPSAQAYACLYAGVLGHSAAAEAAGELDAGPQLRVA